MSDREAMAIAGLLVLAGGVIVLRQVQRQGQGFTVIPAVANDNDLPSFLPVPVTRAPDPVNPAAPVADAFLFFDPLTESAPVSAAPLTMDTLRLRSEVEIVARTVWGEARGEGRRGMAAVAHVIANRAAQGRIYGGPTLRGVCLAPFQFSVWNGDDPNRRATLAVTTADPHYRAALDLVGRVVIAGNLSEVPAMVRGADHYHATTIPAPAFTTKMARLGDVGLHRFYSASGVV